MSETPKKSVFELPKMVTDNPKGNFEVMLNLVYGKDGRSYIRYSEDGTDGMPITDFCFKKLCPEFGCSVFADQTMTDEEQDELLFDCVFDNCPVATVYAALSGYGHLRDRLRMHEDAMTNRVLTIDEVATYADLPEMTLMWVEVKFAKESDIFQEIPIGFNGELVQFLYPNGARLYTDKHNFPPEDYGSRWRCWLRKPTAEETKKTPWEEESHE